MYYNASVVGRRVEGVAVTGFVWDYSPDRNVDHIGSHGVEPEDVEEVLSIAPRFFRNTHPEGASHIMVGPNRVGRFLRVAMVEAGRDDIWYVVTAHWLSRRRGERLYQSE